MNSRWTTIRNEVSTYCLCAAVAAMPFSIAWCHGCLILFVALWLTENNWREKLQRIKNDYQLLILLALGVVVFAGIFYSENQDAAWFALEKKTFFFLAPVVIATSAINSPKLLGILSLFLCLGCFVALIFCYFRAYSQLELYENGSIGEDSVNYLASSTFWDITTPKPWLFFSYVSLSGGIEMHPTYLALYCAFCCIVLTKEFWQAKNVHVKAAIFLLLAFFSLSIIFLAARVVILMLGVIYVLMFGYALSHSEAKWKNVLIPGALIALLTMGVVFNPVTRYRQFEEIAAVGISVKTDTHYSNSTGIRTSLWWLSLKAFSNTNMLIGTGAGDVQESVKAMGQNYSVTNVLNSYDPHSQYLFFLLSSGLIGLTLFACYLAIGFVKAWHNRDIVFLNFLLLFSAVCLTESVLELQKGIVFFSIFFSSMTFSRMEPKPNQSLLEFANAGN